MSGFSAVQGHQARIFIDEFELTQQSSGASFTSEMQVIQYPIMGDPAQQQQVTSPTFTIPHRGYYTGRGATGDLGYFEDTLQKRLGSTTPVTVSLMLGPITYTMFGTWGTQLTIDAPVADLITIEGNWASPDSVKRGLVAANQTFTDLATSTPVDLGAVGIANGAVIHASGFADLSAGAETVIVTVETASTSGGAYILWLSHTFKKPGAVLKTGSPNPNRWMRVKVDFTAGVPGPVNAMASATYV